MDTYEKKYKDVKFKVGYWIIDKSHSICLITDIDLENGYYVCESNRFGNIYGDIDLTDKAFHLWTIKDVKDGDVLATKNIVFIFKHMDKAGLNLCRSYCEVIGNSKLGFGFDFSINDVHPATKEQHDLLFKKIHEAGYEWDTKAKKLIKIKQVSAWSEEDEGRLNIICGLLEDIPSHQIWLKGLKNRMMLLQKVTCNEKDKEKLEMLINKASYNCLLKNDDISFLKSLKQRMEE